jgi:hypothetical protein
VGAAPAAVVGANVVVTVVAAAVLAAVNTAALTADTLTTDSARSRAGLCALLKLLFAPSQKRAHQKPVAISHVRIYTPVQARVSCVTYVPRGATFALLYKYTNNQPSICSSINQPTNQPKAHVLKHCFAHTHQPHPICAAQPLLQKWPPQRRQQWH